MKKTLVGTLALGLIIGAGTLTAKSFANEKIDTQNLVNTTNVQSLSNTDTGFRVLNQETNQFEQIDDSEYRNSNPNYGQECYGGNSNRQQCGMGYNNYNNTDIK